MKCWSLFPFALVISVVAQEPVTTTQLTVYQDFAVAHTSVPLNLRVGMNEVLTTSVTSQLEPDSVVLRDAAGRHPIRVVEQNYDAAVVNQNWLLQKYEGKVIDFQTYGMQVIETTTGERKTLPAVAVKGRIIRAGDQPMIEVDGHIQFSLPGMPIFPAETDGLLLKPTLRWQIESKDEAKFSAELDYITRGMSWQATYNVVVPEAADVTGPEMADIVGWVTIKNDSGTDFPQATIQLMAGDVAKIRSNAMGGPMDVNTSSMRAYSARSVEVTQKEFDDFHLYDLHRTVALRNRESKQVQFLEAAGVSVKRNYEFDGNAPMFQNFYPGYHNDQRSLNDAGSKTIFIREEIKNSTQNHLGLPLPAGRLRLYRRETTGQVQFVGESMVPHTPAERALQVISGNAFDLTAERRQTEFHVDQAARTIDETFEIKLSNQKAQPVVIDVVEHMNRGQNWQITSKSTEFRAKDSATIVFPVSVTAKGETTLLYSVRYTW